MRRLPKFVRVGGLKVGIGKIDGLLHDNDHDTHRAYGVFDPGQYLIYLDGASSAERTKVTLVHEVLHMVINTARLELDPEDEEKLVGRTAPLLLDFIRANRGAIAYLQES